MFVFWHDQRRELSHKDKHCFSCQRLELLRLLPCVSLAALEVCEPKHRATVGILIGLPWALGTMAWGGMAYLIRDWRWLQFAVSFPNLLVFLPLLWVSDSRMYMLLYLLAINSSSLSQNPYSRVSNIVAASWTNPRGGWSCEATTIAPTAPSTRLPDGTTPPSRQRMNSAPLWWISRKR